MTDRSIPARVLRIFPSDLLLLVARLFLGAPFITFGVMKFLHHASMASYVERAGVPGWFVWVVIPYQALAGLGVAVGFQTRLCAFLLGGFCVVATLLYHSNIADLGELSNFTKDFATAGGFVCLWLCGPGRFSLDGWRSGAGRSSTMPLLAQTEAGRS